MSTRTLSICYRPLSLFVLFLLFTGCTEESTYLEPEGPEAHIADSLADILRTRFYARDFEGGAEEGKQFLHDHYSSRLHAWYLLNLSRNRRGAQARAEAIELTKHLPESAWSWMALAGVIHYTAPRRGADSLDAVMISEMALQIADYEEDIQYIHGQVLRSHKSPEEALNYIKTLGSLPSLPANVLVSRAQAFYASANDYTSFKNQALIDSAFAMYKKARETDPSVVDAYYLPGDILNRKNRDKEALELFEEAIVLSPYSSSVRKEYGHVILGQPDIDTPAKHELVRGIIREAMQLRSQSPENLYMVADLYGDIGDERRRNEVESQLLHIEPKGSRAEWTLLRQIREFNEDHQAALSGQTDPAIVREYRTMLNEFTNRDWVIREDLLGEVYQKRFFVVDSTVSDKEVLDILDGMDAYSELNPHITYYHGPIALAERGAYFREAETIARKGFKAFQDQIEQFGGRKRFESDKAYQKALAASAWWGNDALGWIYFNEGRIEKAEEFLARAYDLSEGKRIDVLLHLGKLYEKRYDMVMEGQGGDAAAFEEALDSESLYITAFSYYKEASAIEVPYGNPGEEALRALYTRRNGSEEGYEAFLATLEKDNTRQRKRNVLAARIEEPEPIKPFRLVALDGRVYSNEILEGKSVAINVWSTTCGPCLMEMPEIQKLHEQYMDDPDVLVLTITKDYNPGDAKRWIEDKGYTFPVLVDNGYLNEMNVRAYPFTWFLDSEQRINYTKTGWSKYLQEEFSWRLEELR